MAVAGVIELNAQHSTSLSRSTSTPPAGSAVARVEAALEQAGSRRGSRGMWSCPGHDDRTPSLHVSNGGGRVLLYDHGGCPPERVLDALGLRMADLFDGDDDGRGEDGRTPHRHHHRDEAPGRTVEPLGPATFEQRAALVNDGRLLRDDTLAALGAQLVRAWGSEWLGFPTWGGEGWKLWGLDGDGRMRRDPRGRMQRKNAGDVSMIASPTIVKGEGEVLRLWDVEGESDLIAAVDAGMPHVVAGTGGAASLKGHEKNRERLLALKPAEMVVVRDRDAAGREGAGKAAAWWLAQGVPVRVVELPTELGDGGDVRDYLRDFGAADLDALADEVELRQPEAAEGKARVRPLSYEEIDSDTMPAAIVENLLYERSASLFVGLAKRGKSYAAIQLALSLVSGRNFLGRPVRSSRTLYLSWELAAAPLRERMRAVARDVPDIPSPDGYLRDGRLALYAPRFESEVPPINLAEPGGWEDLADLTEQARADVLIIDTLAKVTPTLEHKNTNGWHALLRELNTFCREQGVAVLAIDHAHRGRIEENASTAAIGSQTKGSAVGLIAKLTESREPEPLDRTWSLETDSWFGDGGRPLYFKRPEVERDGQREAGCGCVLAEPPEPERVGTKVERCREWLVDYLGNRHRTEVTWVPKGDVLAADKLRDEPFGEPTIKRAARGIVDSDKGFGGSAVWRLKPDDPDAPIDPIEPIVEEP